MTGGAEDSGSGIEVRVSDAARKVVAGIDDQLTFLVQQVKLLSSFARGAQDVLSHHIKEALHQHEFVYNERTNGLLVDSLEKYLEFVDHVKGMGVISEIDYQDVFATYALAFKPQALSRDVPAEPLARFLEKRNKRELLELPDLDELYVGVIPPPDALETDNDLADLAALTGSDPSLSTTKDTGEKSLALATSDFIPHEALGAPVVKRGILAKLYNLCADAGIPDYVSTNGVSEAAMHALDLGVTNALSKKGTYARLVVYLDDTGSKLSWDIEPVPGLVYISRPVTKDTLSNESKRKPVIDEIISAGRKYLGADDVVFGTQARAAASERVVALLQHDVGNTNRTVRFTLYQEPGLRPTGRFKVEEIVPMF